MHSIYLDKKGLWGWTEILGYIYTGTTDQIFDPLLFFLYYSAIVCFKSDCICLDTDMEIIHMPQIINKHTSAGV